MTAGGSAVRTQLWVIPGPSWVIPGLLWVIPGAWTDVVTEHPVVLWMQLDADAAGAPSAAASTRPALVVASVTTARFMASPLGY
jgi:hypothetical protein